MQNSEVKGEDVYYYDKKMRRITEIGPGEQFGGMNLNSDNVKNRMAAILADEDSEFLILERKSYNVSFHWLNNWYIEYRNWLEDSELLK